MRGFTLLETVITTAILVIGLVAVATVFSYSTGTNTTTQQRMAATVLLYEKMEQFKSASLGDTHWIPGGNLNPDTPASGYFDYVTVDSVGGLSTSTTDTSLPYMRVWQITATVPRSVTLAVYARKAAISGRRVELIRATAAVSHNF